MKIKQHISEQPVGHRRNKKAHKKYLETKWNENTVYQNLWDVSKAALRRKFIAINAHIKKREIFQINKQDYFTPQGARKKSILATKRTNI